MSAGQALETFPSFRLFSKHRRASVHHDWWLFASAPVPIFVHALGDLYVVGSNGVMARDIKLEEFGRELGVLKGYEKVVH